MKIQTVEQLIHELERYDPSTFICCTSTVSDGQDSNYTIDEVDYDAYPDGALVILHIKPDKGTLQ